MSCCVDVSEWLGQHGRLVVHTGWVEIEPDDTEAHVAGDVVSDPLVFACVARKAGTTVKLVQVDVIEEGDGTDPAVGAPLDLILYAADATPAPTAQNTAYVPPTDLTKVLGIVTLAPGAHDLDANQTLAQERVELDMKLPDGSTTIHGVLVTRAGATWTNGTVQKLRLKLILEID